MDYDKIILLLIIGLASGITASSFFNLDFGFAAFFVFMSAIFYFLVFSQFQNTKFLFALSFLFFGFGFGILRYEIKDHRNYALNDSTDKNVILKGIVSGEPDKREKYTGLIVKILSRCSGKPSQCADESKTKILVYAGTYPEFKYGDEILIKGKLSKPNNFKTESGRDFNWEDYLAKDDVFYEIFYPEIELIASGKGNPIKRALLNIKERFIENLSGNIPEPSSSFMSGITVGAKKLVSEELKENFIKTGIIHIMVLSGYNITVVAKVVMNFFEIFLSRAIASIFGILSVILFSLMAGAAPSVARAAIMSSIVILAASTGRIYQATAALIAAGFLMILHNPKILRFDLSFQLSFLATIGLIHFSPRLEKILKFVPEKFKIREVVSSALSAQILTAPLLLHAMGNFSIVSLPVNLLILPFIPITMFLGFLTGISGFISHFLSVVFGWLSYVFLYYELSVVNFFADLPFSSVVIPYFPAFAVLLIYSFFFAVLFLRRDLE